MKISVFGLGYVGCISLGCLAKAGHQVTGVDVNSAKVELIRSGKPTILEKDIGAIIEEQFEAGRIEATTDPEAAVLESDLSILCVGTPSSDSGHLNLDQIFQVARQIGAALNNKKSFHTIVIRSTVPPGTNLKVAEIIETVTGQKNNAAVVSNPEFLREGSAVKDYYNPPFTLIGTENPKAVPIMEELYRGIAGTLTVVDVKVAEMIKYVNNSFHALKVGFANEVGNICKKMGVDSFEVMDIFTRDRVLNISPAYLKPGFAYGGACLPKDLKALSTMAHDFYLETPIINAIQPSNENQKLMALNLVTAKGKRSIGFLGLSFKNGTDDLRNSPAVEIIEQLMGKGYRVSIHDKHVRVSQLMGANKAFIQEHLPHFSEIISDDLEHVASQSEVLVIIHNQEEYKGLAGKYPDKEIIDLVRVEEQRHAANYEGLSW
jgi:GDP-mannose 6-dehydrogenase